MKKPTSHYSLVPPALPWIPPALLWMPLMPVMRDAQPLRPWSPLAVLPALVFPCLLLLLLNQEVPLILTRKFLVWIPLDVPEFPFPPLDTFCSGAPWTCSGCPRHSLSCLVYLPPAGDWVMSANGQQQGRIISRAPSTEAPGQKSSQ